MAEWLLAERNLFGLTTQNWMWLVAGIFLVYGLAIVLMRHGRPLG
jgi:hypothetical protein